MYIVPFFFFITSVIMKFIEILTTMELYNIFVVKDPVIVFFGFALFAGCSESYWFFVN